MSGVDLTPVRPPAGDGGELPPGVPANPAWTCHVPRQRVAAPDHPHDIGGD